MGNSAVIVKQGSSEGVYLHWNGGRDSVEPIVWYAHNFITDEEELQAIYNVCKWCGLNPYRGKMELQDCDNGDNGVYIVEDGKIIGRVYNHGEEQDNYDFNEFVCSLNEEMPGYYRVDKNFLLQYLASKEVNRKDVKDGDYLYVEKNLFHPAVFLKVLSVRKESFLLSTELEGGPNFPLENSKEIVRVLDIDKYNALLKSFSKKWED